MPSEPYSRIVVDAGGNIVMVAHLDYADQYNSPSFTVPGCANADMPRIEYDAAAGAYGPLGTPLSDVPASEGEPPLDDGEFPPAEPNPALVQKKSMLELAASKLDPVKETSYIAAIEVQIAVTQARIEVEMQPGDNPGIDVLPSVPSIQ